MADVDQEILRLRDRQHDQSASIVALEFHARENARRMDELELQLRNLAEHVAQMSQADEVARAVTDAMRRERRNLLTWPRKAGALVLALLVAVPAIHELAGWIHW